MKKQVMYLAKIDRKVYAKFKDGQDRLSVKLLFQLWVDYFADFDRFQEFFIDGDITEQELEQQYDDVNRYKLVEIDQENWSLFMSHCRAHKMYARDAINILVRRFNNNGFCITTEIEV